MRTTTDALSSVAVGVKLLWTFQWEHFGWLKCVRVGDLLHYLERDELCIDRFH